MLLQRSTLSIAIKPIILLTLVALLLLLIINSGRVRAPADRIYCPEYFHLLEQVKAENTSQSSQDRISYMRPDLVTRNSSFTAHLNNAAFSEIFIAVKTTKKYHKDRLQLLIDTWIQLTKNNTWVFTDADDSSIDSKLAPGHLINTGCGAKHEPGDLVCKLAAIFEHFIRTQHFKWMCVVDDDTYINMHKLVLLLSKYPYTEDWYIGKPSLNRPWQSTNSEREGVCFWFATGGAGYCLSRSLTSNIIPHTKSEPMMEYSKRTGFPDDLAIAYFSSVLCHAKLTPINEFHSHLEPLWKIPPDQLQNQISLSYGQAILQQEASITASNTVNTGSDKAMNTFDLVKDPTRLRSVHCWLFPGAPNCPTANNEK